MESENENEMIHHYIVPIDGLISDLINLPEECGVCIDVFNNSLNRVLFLENSGLDFDTFLRAWAKCLETTADSSYKRTLMIRVRSHSIEESCLELLEKHHITDYFFEGSYFLDIYDTRTQTPDRAKFAYRYSEYEGIEDLLRNPELYDWLLIDSLTGRNLLNDSLYEWSQKNGIRICLRLCTNKSPTSSASSAFISDKGNCSHALEKCEGVKAPALHGLPYDAKFFQKFYKYDDITMLLPLSYLDL